MPVPCAELLDCLAQCWPVKVINCDSSHPHPESPMEKSAAMLACVCVLPWHRMPRRLGQPPSRMQERAGTPNDRNSSMIAWRTAADDSGLRSSITLCPGRMETPPPLPSLLRRSINDLIPLPLCEAANVLQPQQAPLAWRHTQSSERAGGQGSSTSCLPSQTSCRRASSPHAHSSSLLQPARRRRG